MHVLKGNELLASIPFNSNKFVTIKTQVVYCASLLSSTAAFPRALPWKGRCLVQGWTYPSQTEGGHISQTAQS